MSVRVTKFNPARRNSAGHFLDPDWTSISDVGRVLGGHLVTAAEYYSVEDNYVAVLTAIAREAKAATFSARGLEVRSSTRLEGVAPIASSSALAARLAEPVSDELLEQVIRACLREDLWCRLVSADERCEIHFGYDYYSYVSGVQPSAELVERARRKGIYVEPFQSPYAGCRGESDGAEGGEELA